MTCMFVEESFEIFLGLIKGTEIPCFFATEAIFGSSVLTCIREINLDFFADKEDILLKIGKYKVIKDDNLLDFDSLDSMKCFIKNNLKNECYEIDKIIPLDMFPQTKHVECIVNLKKVAS